MTKEKIIKILFFLVIALVAVFFTMVFIDYSYYDASYSAPFSAYILVRALEFVLPSLILLIIALILRKKK